MRWLVGGIASGWCLFVHTFSVRPVRRAAWDYYCPKCGRNWLP